jgi:Tfp pilus assembly protein PilF
VVALARLSTGDPRGAVSELEPYADSQDARTLNDLAAAYLVRRRTGDARRALDLLERAVVIEPARVEAWFNLGLAAEAQDQTSRAIDAWRQMLKLEPDSGWATEARLHLDKLTTR